MHKFDMNMIWFRMPKKQQHDNCSNSHRDGDRRKNFSISYHFDFERVMHFP